MSVAASAYFQPDDLMPSPRYVSDSDVTFTGSNLHLKNLELNWQNGRVNAPTGGGTVNSIFAGNEYGVTLYNNSGFNQRYGGHDTGQAQIHDAGSGNYDLEMLQLNISDALPSGYMLRESPTLASTGQSTLTPTTGGYNITSFFDVFFELSIDGGSTWMPSSGPVHLTGQTPEPASMAVIFAGLGGLILKRRKKS